MKRTRKLIPAIAMLLISAVMMATASFAWFSLNETVFAEGMKVTAVTPASLEIATDIGDGTANWSHSATGAAAEGSLNPVYIDTTTKKAYIPTSVNTIKPNGDTQVPFKADDTTNWMDIGLNPADGKGSDGKYYAYVETFYLRTNTGANDEADTMWFTAAATIGGTSNLKEGVEVYIYDGTNYVKINGTASTQKWEAPLATEEPIALTVVVVYNGTLNTYINNSNADLAETTVSVTFAKTTAPDLT
jgi:hypothetical protein